MFKKKTNAYKRQRDILVLMTGILLLHNKKLLESEKSMGNKNSMFTRKQTDKEKEIFPDGVDDYLKRQSMTPEKKEQLMKDIVDIIDNENCSTLTDSVCKSCLISKLLKTVNK